MRETIGGLLALLSLGVLLYAGYLFVQRRRRQKAPSPVAPLITGVVVLALGVVITPAAKEDSKDAENPAPSRAASSTKTSTSTATASAPATTSTAIRPTPSAATATTATTERPSANEDDDDAPDPVEVQQRYFLAVDDLALHLDTAVADAIDDKPGALRRIKRFRSQILARVNRYILSGGESIGGNLLLSAATTAREAAIDENPQRLIDVRDDIREARDKLAEEALR